MSTITNREISIYCCFNKIIKGSRTSFQSPALSEKFVRNVCRPAHQYLTRFHFDSTQDSKEISISATSVMQHCLVSQVDFTKKTKFQISREQKMFTSNKKNYQLHIKGYLMANSFVGEISLMKNQFEPKQETLLKTLLIIHNIQ